MIVKKLQALKHLLLCLSLVLSNLLTAQENKQEKTNEYLCKYGIAQVQDESTLIVLQENLQRDFPLIKTVKYKYKPDSQKAELWIYYIERVFGEKREEINLSDIKRKILDLGMQPLDYTLESINDKRK